MNRFPFREECLRNNEILQRFYNEVINTFFSRLFKEYKFKSTMSEEAIEELENVIVV